MITPEEIKAEYTSSLADLTFNSKPLINMLTILAKENLSNAKVIVQVIEAHLSKVNADVKLPILYLIDSIVKNVGRTYTSFFAINIVQTFCDVFYLVDKKNRAQMFKLRQTWKYIFPQTKLRAIDRNINTLDASWSVAAQPSGSIQCTPKFITGVVTPTFGNINKGILLLEEELIQQQKKLLELKQKRLELEIMDSQVKLQLKAVNTSGSSVIQERLQNHLACQPHNVNPVSSAPASARPIEDPRLPNTFKSVNNSAKRNYSSRNHESAQDEALQSFASPPKKQAKIVADSTKEKAIPSLSAKEDRNIARANIGVGVDLRHVPAVLSNKRTSTAKKSRWEPRPTPLIKTASEPVTPNALTTAENINPFLTHLGSALNVNEWFQKLLASGILKVKSETAETKPPPAPVVPVRGKRSTVQPRIPPPRTAKTNVEADVMVSVKNMQRSIMENLQPVSFDRPETLKIRQDPLYKELYAGMECSNCSMKFRPQDSLQYGEHLDWHFRENRKRKEASRGQNYFEQERQAREAMLAKKEEKQKVPSVKADFQTTNQVCEVCRENFDFFFHQEKEEWNLRNAMEVDGSIYHPVCYDDYKQSISKCVMEEPKSGLE